MSDQISQEQRPGLGIFWMVVTGLCFVAVTALVKTLQGRLPAAEAAFLRYAMGLVFLRVIDPLFGSHQLLCGDNSGKLVVDQFIVGQ